MAVSVQAVLCPRGTSVQGVFICGVSVEGVVRPGGLCPGVGDLCQGDPPRQRLLYGNVCAVCILLECIPVCFKSPSPRTNSVFKVTQESQSMSFITSYLTFYFTLCLPVLFCLKHEGQTKLTPTATFTHTHPLILDAKRIYSGTSKQLGTVKYLASR